MCVDGFFGRHNLSIVLFYVTGNELDFILVLRMGRNEDLSGRFMNRFMNES